MDQVRDYSGRLLYKVSCLFETPDFVKSATPRDVLGDEATPSVLFADPVQRYYPCHSAPATWLSAAYLLCEPSTHLRKEALDLAWSRIKGYGETFGVTSYLDELVKKARRQRSRDGEEESASQDDYSLVLTRADGSKERLYPIRNSEEVKVAAEYLSRYRDRFPLPHRRQMAQAILDKAARFHVRDEALQAATPWLLKQAGHGFCTSVRAAELLRGRAAALSRLGKDPNSQEKLAMLADRFLKDKGATYDDDTLRKLANWVDYLDRSYDLRREGLPAPEDVLYELNIETLRKVASEHVPLANGAVFRKDDLLRLPADELEGLLGLAKSAAITRNYSPTDENIVAFAGSLTSTEASEVEKQAHHYGIAPVYRMRLNDSPRFMSRLTELAALPL